MRINKPVIILFIFLIIFNSQVIAKGDLTKQQPIEKTIFLGDKTNHLRFFPSVLSFETGKLYKLVIKNPSPQKHYFNARNLSDSVFTRKVQVLNKNNSIIAEIKGTINEIEVYPGGTTEWWLVPVKTLHDSPLHCSISGHSEAGMTGKISIK